MNRRRKTYFVNINNLIHESQFVFMENRSTKDAITKFGKNANLLLKCIDIFVDLKKAFDSMSHAKLKMYVLVLIDKMFSWLKNYFSKRTQVAKIIQSLSLLLASDFGIP